MAEYSSLPEVTPWEQRLAGQRGLHGSKEVVAGHEEKHVVEVTGKEVVGRHEEKYLADAPSRHADSSALPESLSTMMAYASANDEDKGTKSGRSRRAVKRKCCIVVAVVLIAIVLGVGLGVGLSVGLKSNGNDKAAPEDTTNQTVPMSNPYPGKGIVAGSDIGLQRANDVANLTTGEKRSTDGQSLRVFFQHHTGELRWLLRTPTGDVEGGTSAEVIATDAKSGTPLGLISTSDTFTQWHVFYVSIDNTLRQRYIDNNTWTWSDGPINDLNVSVFNSSRAGLSSCFYPGPIQTLDDGALNGTIANSGMRVFVATSETSFAQYAWRTGLAQFTYEMEWNDLNAHASPACMAWGAGQVMHVAFVDLEDKVSVYWIDTATDVENTLTHPVNKWTQVSVSTPPVDPDAGLLYPAQGILWARTPDTGAIQGWNMSMAAENTTVLSASSDTRWVIDEPTAASGSGLAAAAGQEHLYVLYSSEGNDITFATGSNDGTWQTESLPIPVD